MNRFLSYAAAAALLCFARAAFAAPAEGEKSVPPATMAPAGEAKPAAAATIPLRNLDAHLFGEMLKEPHGLGGAIGPRPTPERPPLGLPGFEPRFGMPLLPLPNLTGLVSVEKGADAKSLTLKGDGQAMQVVQALVDTMVGPAPEVGVSLDVYNPAKARAGKALPGILEELRAKETLTGEAAERAATAAGVLHAEGQARLAASFEGTAASGSEVVLAGAPAAVHAGVHWLRATPRVVGRSVSADVLLFVGQLDGNTYDGRLVMHSLWLPDATPAALWIRSTATSPEDLVAILRFSIRRPAAAAVAK